MMEISTARCCLETQPQAIFFSRISRALEWENTHKLSYNMAARSTRLGYRGLASSYAIFNAVYPKRPFFCRPHSMATSLEESTSLESESDSNEDEDEDASTESKEEILAQPLTSEQIAALLADTERAKLTKKLSEANQQNRFLKRQLHIKEEALVNFKSELAVMELEVQALVKLAEEIAQSAIPEGSRKINGRYIQSHLVSRLEAVHEKLKEQIKDVDSAKSKEVPVFWVGMAESVQIMGTFDGWSQGEHLSPEYDGSYTKFSATLMLRPGRYEIKFLVDGEWQLSPEFPTVALLADTERAKLTKKLREANQQNRFLKRQLHIKEEALVSFKRELAVMELEVQALVKLAEEIAQSAIPEGSRKINGRYIQSHLVSRLEAVHEKLKEQIKDVDSAQSKEVPVIWVGMAEV